MTNYKPIVTMRKQGKLLMRGINLLNQLAPGSTVLQLLKAFCKATIPYISIYMSAKILSELISGRNIKTLIVYVAITIGTTLLAVILDSTFGYFLKLNETKIESGYEILLNNKTYSMDYSQASRKGTNEQRAQIEMSDRTFSGGVRVLFMYCGSFFESLFSVIIAVVLCASMFHTVKLPDASGMVRVINNEWFSIALLLLVILCLIMLCHAQIKAQNKKLTFNQSMAKYNLLAQYYNESYFDENKAAKDIRIFHQMPFILNKYYNDILSPNWNIMKNYLIANGHVQVRTSVVTAGLGGLVYLFVGLKAWAGIIEVGEVVRYYGAITQMIISCIALISAALSLLHNNEYLLLLFQYLDMPSQTNTGNLPLPPNPESKPVVFENVSFRYYPDGPYALKNMSLQLAPGQRTAIVGMNGSGKTTLIKLLCRFYSPESGCIKLGETDINKFDLDAYQMLFSVVFQDFQLFAFPIGQNVAGALEYNSTRVWNALELAGIKQRILKFPKQLEQTIYQDFEEDGINLSGGEEQKVALARAIYKDAPFVILDEPTAALDPFSEAEIYEKFNDISKDKTVLYISHRLSSCKFCERILVFDQGEIVQSGTHQELIQETNGKYAELWGAQAQYYTKEQK